MSAPTPQRVYGFYRVEHADGLVTSTLVAPTWLFFASQFSVGSFANLIEHMSAQPQEVITNFVAVPAESVLDLGFAIVTQVAAVTVVSAACTAVVAGINHALVVLVAPYRRLNATLTQAADHAPTTVLASSAAGAALFALSAALSRPPGPLTSAFSITFAVLYAPGTTTAGMLYGRWLGQAASATWFGVDKMRQRA